MYNRTFAWSLITALLAAPFLVAGPTSAQQLDSLRAQYLLSQPPSFEIAARGIWVAPGITVSTPSAFGADYGDGFVGVGLQSRTRYRDAMDGGAVAGFGVGNARRYVGLELAFTSFGTWRSCCRGGISAKVHRLLGENASLAAGVENAVTWGHMQGLDEATDAGTSLYAVGSKVFFLQPSVAAPFSTLTLSLGAGNGRFRTEDDILDDREAVNVFGSASVRVIEPISVIANWTGQDLVGGVSLVPFRQIPLFITPAVADLTTEPRFIMGVGYGFDWGGWFN